MSLTWPEDPDIRRVVASWGQSLDEELIADGTGEVPGLDWPEDATVARALAQWGEIADWTVDIAALIDDPTMDPAVAWLGGRLVRDEPVADPQPDVASVAVRSTRKHKRARPGQPVRTTGWTVVAAAEFAAATTAAAAVAAGTAEPAPHRVAGRALGWLGTAEPAPHRVGGRALGRAGTVAAAVAAVLLIGGEGWATSPGRSHALMGSHDYQALPGRRAYGRFGSSFPSPSQAAAAGALGGAAGTSGDAGAVGVNDAVSPRPRQAQGTGTPASAAFRTPDIRGAAVRPAGTGCVPPTAPPSPPAAGPPAGPASSSGATVQVALSPPASAPKATVAAPPAAAPPEAPSTTGPASAQPPVLAAGTPAAPTSGSGAATVESSGGTSGGEGAIGPVAAGPTTSTCPSK